MFAALVSVLHILWVELSSFLSKDDYWVSIFDFVLTGHKLNAFIIYPLNKLKDAQIFLLSKVSHIPLYAAVFIFSQKSMIVLIQEDILQPPVAKNTTESRL